VGVHPAKGTEYCGESHEMISRDVRRLVLILEAEGYGFLAGEILSEVDSGRLVPSDDSGDGVPLKAGFDTDRIPDGRSEDRPCRRQPIPLDEQLAEAIRILRLRLVEPGRRLAEAERLAGNLTIGEPVRFALIENDEVISARSDLVAPGDDRFAAKLDDLLSRILSDEPPMEVG
jgi:hypothetical protein